jgi:ABC-type amino acid transport substrate-binding protein
MNSKFLALSIALCISQQLYSQKYQGDSWEKVKTSGEGALSVLYYEQVGVIQEVNGSPVGVCVDILNDFASYVLTKYHKKLTIKYVAKEAVFTTFLSTVQKNNNLLGVSNVTITDERKQILKFTPPFLTNPVALITHKNAPNLTDLSKIKSTLVDYTVEILAGSTHENHANRIKKQFWPELKISYGPSDQEIMQKIVSNPKLFTIIDFTEFVNATRKNLPLKKQNVEITHLDEELAFIMSKQSDWDVLWKEFLTEDYKKSSRYRKSIVDNLGSSYLSVIKR